MNNQNLQSGKKTQFNSERAAEAGRKSGQARRRKAQIKDIARQFLAMPIKDGELVDLASVDSMEAAEQSNMTVTEKIVLVAVKNAINGDAKAREWLSKYEFIKSNGSLDIFMGDLGRETDEEGFYID